MKHGSLFSGGGGFDLAAERMGWENVFHCEKDTFCQTILKHYWPKAETFTDIKEFNAEKYKGKIDIITGGFPCQPFSAAGKRKGTSDDRYLWPAMYHIIRTVKPRWVVCENVYGLVNWNEGMVFDKVQSDLEAEGYEVAAYVLPAAGVNAPHQGTGSGSSDSTKHIPQQGKKKLIPTPTAFDGSSPSLAGKLRKREQPETASTLTAYVRHNWTRLVPTPTAMDATGCTAKMKSSQVRPGSMHSVTLSRWANMLPTPLASDCNAKRKTANWRGDDLSSKVQVIVGENGQLNPRFVAEMMGFPPDWTILPFQSGEEHR